jgi:hypothetical protein
VSTHAHRLWWLDDPALPPAICQTCGRSDRWYRHTGGPDRPDLIETWICEHPSSDQPYQRSTIVLGRAVIASPAVCPICADRDVAPGSDECDDCAGSLRRQTAGGLL